MLHSPKVSTQIRRSESLVSLTSSSHDIPQMPEPVPDRPQLFCPLFLRFLQRYADLADPQFLPTHFRNHLCGKFHTCSTKLAFFQRILPDTANATVPVVDLDSKFHSAAQRKKWYTKFVGPAHSTIFHLSGKAVAGYEVILVFCERQVDQIKVRKIICAVTIAKDDHIAVCFPQAGTESTAITGTHLRDNTGPAVFCDGGGAVCTVIVDDQDLSCMIEAVIDREQIALCLPNGKGDVFFFVQAGHEDSEIMIVHSPVPPVVHILLSAIC